MRQIPLDWVNAPQQERSQKTLEKLLDAAEKLLIEGGVDAVTVPAVVKRAGSSVGAFYGRFPDKNALLETLHKRACEQTIATADRAFDPALWEGRPLEEIVEAIIAFAIKIFGSRRSVMAAFQQALSGDPAYAQRRADNGVELGKRALALLLQHHRRIGHPDPALAIPMALRFVTATLEQRNSFARKARGVEVDVSDEVLCAELVRMTLSYLAVRP